jgi:hypothetical protein
MMPRPFLLGRPVCLCVRRLVSYFSYQWQDSDALIRANEIAVSQLRNINSTLQVSPVLNLLPLPVSSQLPIWTHSVLRKQIDEVRPIHLILVVGRCACRGGGSCGGDSRWVAEISPVQHASSTGCMLWSPMKSPVPIISPPVIQWCISLGLFEAVQR